MQRGCPQNAPSQCSIRHRAPSGAVASFGAPDGAAGRPKGSLSARIRRQVTTSNRRRRTPRAAAGRDESQADAPRRSRSCLRRSTDSAADPMRSDRRLFTSTKTSRVPRRAIRSISTRSARTLRATMRYPRLSRKRAASVSPARPSSARARPTGGPARSADDGAADSSPGVRIGSRAISLAPCSLSARLIAGGSSRGEAGTAVAASRIERQAGATRVGDGHAPRRRDTDRSPRGRDLAGSSGPARGGLASRRGYAENPRAARSLRDRPETRLAPRA